LKTKLVLLLCMMLGSSVAFAVGLTPGIPHSGKSHASARKARPRATGRYSVRYRKPSSYSTSRRRKTTYRTHRSGRAYSKLRTYPRRYSKPPVKKTYRPAVRKTYPPKIAPKTPVSAKPQPALQYAAPKPGVSIQETVKPSKTTTTAASHPVMATVSASPKTATPATASSTTSPAVRAVAPPNSAPKPHVVKPAPNLPSPTVSAPVTATKTPSETAVSSKPFLPDYEEPQKTHVPLSGILFNFAELLGAFCLVLAIGYVYLLGLRKWMTRSGSMTPLRGRLIHVLETSPLGKDRSIHLVRVGPKTILLSSTAEQITVISEIDDPDFAEQLAASAPASSFSTQLNQAMTGSRPSGINEQVKSGVDHLLERIQDVRALGYGKRGGHL
jgi:flagellar biogenesis protein FliO